MTKTKWGTLSSHEQREILAELTNALYYNDDALDEIVKLLESFKERKMIKTENLPLYFQK